MNMITVSSISPITLTAVIHTCIDVDDLCVQLTDVRHWLNAFFCTALPTTLLVRTFAISQMDASRTHYAELQQDQLAPPVSSIDVSHIDGRTTAMLSIGMKELVLAKKCVCNMTQQQLVCELTDLTRENFSSYVHSLCGVRVCLHLLQFGTAVFIHATSPLHTRRCIYDQHSYIMIAR